MTPTLSFTNPVFNELYRKDFFMEDAVLREILALGPAIAVPELVKIADDTLTHFDPTSPDADWFHTFYFLHALYFLHELDAPEALDFYLRLLRKEVEYQEYWFGDALYETLPDLIAKAGRNRLAECMAAVENSAYSLHSRNVLEKALLQLAIRYPEKRPEVVAFFRRYLQQIITHASQVELLFPADRDPSYGYDARTYIAYLLADLQDINAVELAEEIRQVHRLGLVDETIAGGEQDLVFHTPPVLPVPTIFERYKQLRAELGADSPFNPDAASMGLLKALEEQNRRRNQPTAYPLEPKVGRNDPCPCGSGKKYKKCCME